MLANVDPLEDALIEDQCRLLERFVEDLLDEGIQVEIVLPPQNPWFYREASAVLARDGRLMRAGETEAYVQAFAARKGITVRGSFDGARAGFGESDFVDYCHIRRQSIGRLWEPAALKAASGSR
jgi:hypothetical protein